MVVWLIAQKIPGRDCRWRQDDYGRWMKFADYGKRDSEYGWEVDHIRSQYLGGSDDLNNLRPLHWKSNLERQQEPFGVLLPFHGKALSRLIIKELAKPTYYVGSN